MKHPQYPNIIIENNSEHEITLSSVVNNRTIRMTAKIDGLTPTPKELKVSYEMFLKTMEADIDYTINLTNPILP
jgi:hypothetical protein